MTRRHRLGRRRRPRLVHDGFDGSLELGVPLTDSPFNPDPKPRLSVSVGSRF